jgi:hypothetical protein
LDLLSRKTPFRQTGTDYRSLLLFFFLDCGAINELRADIDFYNNLYKAFCRYIDGDRKEQESLRRSEHPPKYTLPFLNNLIKASLNSDAPTVYDFGNRVITISDAVLVGTISHDKIPIYASIEPDTANVISYCYASNFRHNCVSLGYEAIEDMQLVEPFCDVNDDMVTELAMKRLRALICYISFTKRRHRELDGYQSFEEDLISAIRHITEVDEKRTRASRWELESRQVPVRIFSNFMPNAERFAPFTPSAEASEGFPHATPVITKLRSSSNATGMKRLRGDHDPADVQHREYSVSFEHTATNIRDRARKASGYRLWRSHRRPCKYTPPCCHHAFD